MSELEYQQKITDLEKELAQTKVEALNFLAALKGFNRAAHVSGLNDLLEEYLPKFSKLKSL